jgi:hypothetical protein
VHSSLTEMLATAHRDQLRRQAARRTPARQALRHTAAHKSIRPSPSRRLLHLRLAGRHSEICPADAA